MVVSHPWTELLNEAISNQNARDKALGKAIVETWGCKCGYVHDVEAPCKTGTLIGEYL